MEISGAVATTAFTLKHLLATSSMSDPHGQITTRASPRPLDERVLEAASIVSRMGPRCRRARRQHPRPHLQPLQPHQGSVKVTTSDTFVDLNLGRVYLINQVDLKHVLLHPSTSSVKHLIVKHRQVQGHPIQPSGPVTKVVRRGGPAEELLQTQWMRRVRTPAGADLLRLPTVVAEANPRRATAVTGVGDLIYSTYIPSTQVVVVVITIVELIIGIVYLIDTALSIKALTIMVVDLVKSLHLTDDIDHIKDVQRHRLRLCRGSTRSYFNVM
ncbi:hypothetical protein V8E36_007098, partial [Tilletia maclaganii]